MSNPLHEVLEHWKTAFDGHQADDMAALFSTDALFQGFGPEVIAGRDAVRGYYDAVEAGRTADVTVLHTYTIGDRVAGGFADVTFRDSKGWEVAVHLSMVLQREGREGREGEAWRIRQYHVSQVMSEH